jgi:hypothetical protein
MAASTRGRGGGAVGKLPIEKRGKLPSKPELPSPQCAKSWRDVLPVHPAADLFPMMSESELRALGEDIKKNGLRVAVAVFKEQKHFPPVLLDGRNRLAAMEAADIGIRAESAGSDADPQVKLWFRPTDKDMWLPIEIVEARGDHADGNPFEYVVSANIHRRHLTGEQKRELIGKLLKATPEKSNRQIAATVKVSHVTVGAVRAEMESTGQIDQLVETVGKDRKARPSKRKRPPTEDQIHRQMAAKRAAVPKPLPTAKLSPRTKNSRCCASSPASSLVAPASALIPRITLNGRCCSTASSKCWGARHCAPKPTRPPPAPPYHRVTSRHPMRNGCSSISSTEREESATGRCPRA